MLNKAPVRDQKLIMKALDLWAEAHKPQASTWETEGALLASIAMAGRTLAPSDPALSKVLCDVALLYQSQGRLGDANVLMSLALKTAEDAVGPGGGWVAVVADRLAITYAELGERSEAERLFMRSIRIAEKTFAPDHPFLAVPLSNLAVIYVSGKRYDQAETLLQRALEIEVHAYGPNHDAVEKTRKALEVVRAKMLGEVALAGHSSLQTAATR
jgi:tetratricopeptide (TPR) repeat protein